MKSREGNKYHTVRKLTYTEDSIHYLIHPLLKILFYYMIAGTIGHLVSKDFPETIGKFTSSSSHIHNELSDVQCLTKDFAVIQEVVDKAVGARASN